MITANYLCSLFKKHGFNFSVGVPCSILKNLIRELEVDADIPYIAAAREDEALGICSGAYLAGKKPMVLMQNSGLGNSINVLASLNLMYGIGVLLLISWRGYESNDAPEHIIMGRSTLQLLEDIGVPIRILIKDNAEEIIRDCLAVIERQQTPVAIVIRKGVLE